MGTPETAPEPCSSHDSTTTTQPVSLLTRKSASGESEYLLEFLTYEYPMHCTCLEYILSGPEYPCLKRRIAHLLSLQYEPEKQGKCTCGSGWIEEFRKGIARVSLADSGKPGDGDVPAETSNADSDTNGNEDIGISATSGGSLEAEPAEQDKCACGTSGEVRESWRQLAQLTFAAGEELKDYLPAGTSGYTSTNAAPEDHLVVEPAEQSSQTEPGNQGKCTCGAAEVWKFGEWLAQLALATWERLEDQPPAEASDTNGGASNEDIGINTAPGGHQVEPAQQSYAKDEGSETSVDWTTVSPRAWPWDRPEITKCEEHGGMEGILKRFCSTCKDEYGSQPMYCEEHGGWKGNLKKLCDACKEVYGDPYQVRTCPITFD